MKGHPVHRRLGYAAAGLRAAFRRESSFRIHVRTLVAALVVLALARPDPLWWAAFALAAALVLALELVNSALEGLIDLVHPGLHPEVKAAKDMAAGAVLVAGLGAAAVAACALADGWPRLLGAARWLTGAWR